MNIEEHFGSQASPSMIRKLRTKIKRPDSAVPMISNSIKKKKIGGTLNKMLKSSLKKKKKSVVKKIVNQIDFNHYKKIFCSAFNKYDPNNTINPYKSNFHAFYNLVKLKTETNPETTITPEEKELDMTGFMKTRKESVNLKALEKTNKVLQSTMELVEKDPTFLETFDFVKVCSNVGDVKIKLDQARKIIQKYNLNEEYYNTNNQRDENIEQLVFAKRLKLYENLKQDSASIIDSVPYDIHFNKKGQEKAAEKNEQMAIENAEKFTSITKQILEASGKLDESLLNVIHDSQLDYILKFENKDDINIFLKNLRSMIGNVTTDDIEITERDNGPGLGWKILKQLISQNLEGKNASGKTLEILTSKERLRTQRKSSDFLYYEPSIKKNSSLDPELKRTPKDKASITKKKSEPANPKNMPQLNTNNKEVSTASQNGMKKDSKIPTPLPPKLKKPEVENSKILKSSEILIEDYRDVLHHAFKNLSAQDPNFSRTALMQDEDIERKTGISLRHLPQVHHENKQSRDFTRDIEYSNDSYNGHSQIGQSEWVRPKPAITIPNPINRDPTPIQILSPIPTQPIIANIPVLITPNRSQSTGTLKQSDTNSPGIQPIVTNQPVNLGGPFQPIVVKPRIGGDPRIPEFKNSPQMKNFRNPIPVQSSPNQFTLESPQLQGRSHSDMPAKVETKMSMPVPPQKNFILDRIINSDEGGMSINYYNIFNSMEQQSAEKIKKPGNLSAENSNDKPFIKKNNIILTHNSLPNS